MTTSDLLKRVALFIVLVLAQAIVLGRIHLFNCATPLIYVYFITLFPRNYPKWAVLLWSFLMGLMVDTFTNTPGLASASLTLLALIQPYYYELFVPRDSVESLKPSLVNLGPTKYSYYVVMMVLFYCMVFYALEFFSFFNLREWGMNVLGSSLITLAFIYTFEIAKSSKG